MAQNKRTILVPVDFSEFAEAALIWAAEAATCFDARLVILHVVHDPGSAPGYYTHTKRKKHLHRLEDAAADMLEEFLDKVRRRRPELKALAKADSKLIVGLPVNRILEVAAADDVWLIVMGSQGRTGLPRVLMGSKAERVVQMAPVPVTIVKKAPSKRKS